MPKTIICEKGSASTSDLMQMYFHAMNVKPYYNSPMNHELIRAERYIRTLNNIICRNLTGIENIRQFVSIKCITPISLEMSNEHTSFKSYGIFSIMK